MNKGLWVVDETVTHMTSFRLATQAEIDAAASEQLRKDAAVGKAIRKWLDKCENNGASVLIRQWVEDCRYRLSRAGVVIDILKTRDIMYLSLQG